jgi:uncharacterized protein YueI
MRPPSIYLQLSHFYNHGLAISSKKNFEECFSPHLSSKSPSPQRDITLEKERERKCIEKKEEGKKKSSKSLYK